jgi:hypothetical protein
MVPGNFRAALQVLPGQEVGEVTQNVLYSFRHLEALVLPEVICLLKFVWRHPSNLLASFKQSVNACDPMLVPAILRVLFLENVQSFNSHPLVMEYCLARCFRMKANQIVMAQCGDNASTVAAVLSILRAGACSYIVLSNMSDQQAKDFVNDVRQSRVLNVISPMIRRLREMQRRKPKRRKTTVSPDCDIAVDGFEKQEQDEDNNDMEMQDEAAHAKETKTREAAKAKLADEAEHEAANICEAPQESRAKLPSDNEESSDESVKPKNARLSRNATPVYTADTEDSDESEDSEKYVRAAGLAAAEKTKVTKTVKTVMKAAIDVKEAYQSQDKKTRLRRSWPAHEGSKLKDAVQRYGGNNWAEIAAPVPDRTREQCWSRWHNAFV